jgi:LCP family protein required for cell wall assembly
VASKDKPYRVYRGGRVKGPIRHEPAVDRRRGDRDPYHYRGPKPPRKPRRRWLKRGVIVLIALLVLGLLWAILGYLAFRSGVEEANERLSDRAAGALAEQQGLLGRADAIMLVRTDPDENRIALLSIPRDLRVEIPGRGTDKVNAAYAHGGPSLTVRTVQSLTGLRINHVVVVDFATFPEVIDALGGVTIDVPARIVSNRFECPYGTPARCDRWPGWRFRAGPQEMNGRRALIYSRIRENRLDPSESDITRGGRQQAVIQAIADEAVSFGTYLRGPFIGDDLVKPLATDLSAGEFTQLGWVKFRTPSNGVLRCRLGGTIADIGGANYIIGSEDNASVIAMITGRSAPQPPRPGSGPFGPGCAVGRA